MVLAGDCGAPEIAEARHFRDYERRINNENGMIRGTRVPDEKLIPWTHDAQWKLCHSLVR